MSVITRLIAPAVLATLLGGTSALAAQAETQRGVAQPALLRPAPPPGTDFTITTKIQPAEHLGPCPVKVAFIATITAKKAGPVRYHLRTSDNAYDPVRELMFTAPGTKSFAVTRNLPPPGSGWAFFEIVGPQPVSSEMAYYDVQCTTDSSSPPTSRSPSAAADAQRSAAATNARATIQAAREAAAAQGQPQGADQTPPGQPAPAVSHPAAQAAVKPELLVPKPDLVITGVTGSHVKGDGTPGTLVWKFLVEVKNNGLTEAGSSFLCAHENPALAPQASKNPVPKLGSQQSAKVEYWYGKPSWAFLEGGERKKRPLVFVADCQASITEGSETNNRYSVWLYWDPTEAKTWEPAQ